MKILGQPVGSVYLWSIALLSLLAMVSSYTMGVFPAPLALAVILAGFLEMAMRKYYLGQPFRAPFSGLITGLIIGSVAPVDSPYLMVAAAVLVAIVSKFTIKYRGANVLNPASIGLIAALPLFGFGAEWWAASNYNVYGLALSLTPVLIILAYKVRRLPAALSFITASIVLAILTSGTNPLSMFALFSVFAAVNYFFAFVMLVEPKTSPSGGHAQAAYGASIAVMYFGLSSLRFAYPLLAALLAGNVLYFAYRRYGRHVLSLLSSLHPR